MKLHLGCGQRYLDGYVNIDFPPGEHTVQAQSVADLHADLRTLHYPPGSVDEVRLHHVFEHFPRPVACALLAVWHTWLRPGGVLHLEVPDFARMAVVILNPLSSVAAKAVAERHLYGSHEAAWAAHCEGYTPALLRALVEVFGFETREVRKKSWQGTHNFELVARRVERSYGLGELRERASRYLANFLVDDSPSEQALHQIWMQRFSRYAAQGGGNNG